MGIRERGRMMLTEKQFIVKGARYAAIVGKEFEAGVIVAQVDGQIRKWAIIDALAALPTKARDWVEQYARCEGADIKGLFPVRLVPYIVTLIAQGILMRQHEVAVPREKVSNIMNPLRPRPFRGWFCRDGHNDASGTHLSNARHI